MSTVTTSPAVCLVEPIPYPSHFAAVAVIPPELRRVSYRGADSAVLFGHRRRDVWLACHPN